MTPLTPSPLQSQHNAALGGRTILETLMSESSLAAVAAAAQQEDPAAAPPPPAAAAQPAPAPAPAPTPAPAAAAAPPAPAAASGPAPITARAALELTALAHPSMSATLTKLAAAADGGEAAFRTALLADRNEANASAPVSTAHTSTAQKAPGARSAEGRGSGLKAAAAAQNT